VIEFEVVQFSPRLPLDAGDDCETEYGPIDESYAFVTPPPEKVMLHEANAP
jgi:hypothetical protein